MIKAAVAALKSPIYNMTQHIFWPYLFFYSRLMSFFFFYLEKNDSLFAFLAL